MKLLTPRDRLAPWLGMLLLVAVVACSDPPRYASLPAGSVVLAFGDSVTYGTGAARGEDYPTQLAALTGWQIVNAGRPGDTAMEATARIGRALAQSRPVLAIVELGGNDFLRRRPAADVKEDLRSIIRTIREADVVPVLVSVPEVPQVGAAALGRLADSPIYRELGEEEQVLVIDGVFAEVLSNAGLRADRVHPNAAGYRQLAEGIAAQLERAGMVGGAE